MAAAALALACAACASTETSSAGASTSSVDVTTTKPVPSTSPPSASVVETTPTQPPTATTTEAPVVVKTGSQRLVDDNFSVLDGKRVGLIAHQASIVGESHLADLLDAAPNVELVAMFGPEHGVRGTADAGEYVESTTDPTTGLPLFSLFGRTRQPTVDMLEGIDVLVYDLQDVGTRYYTYISTMGLAMQAAATNDIEFVVLERPNPLGDLVGGGVLEAERSSFVGQYPIPDVYGLTSLQLAELIVAEALLPGLDTLTLTGVPAVGLDPTMRWADTGLPWIPPSPAITTPETALLYPATIYFEATSLSYGRGTETPFEVIGAPWLDTATLQAELDGRSLPGVAFEATTINPEMLPGMTVEPAYLGEVIPALQLTVTDPSAIQPTELGVHVLDAVFAQAREAGVDALSRPDWLDQLSGSTLLRTDLLSGALAVDDVLAEQAANRQNMFEQLPTYPR